MWLKKGYARATVRRPTTMRVETLAIVDARRSPTWQVRGVGQDDSIVLAGDLLRKLTCCKIR